MTRTATTAANGMTPEKALTTLRAIWAALLFGQISFMGFIAVNQASNPSAASDPQVGKIMFFVALAMLVTSVPIGYFIRSQVYKKNWHQDVITPSGYVTGNVILLSLCEAVALTGLAAAYISGVMWYVGPSMVAMAVQVINFPHGGPMRPDHHRRLRTD